MKKQDEVSSGNGMESQVFCALDKGNPLPTFKWEYQNMNCPDFDTRFCEPVESQWMDVPESVIMTPQETPTNKSVVKVQSDQPTASYRCQASNDLGSDAHVINLVRRGKVSVTLIIIIVLSVQITHFTTNRSCNDFHTSRLYLGKYSGSTARSFIG